MSDSECGNRRWKKSDDDDEDDDDDDAFDTRSPPGKRRKYDAPSSVDLEDSDDDSDDDLESSSDKDDDNDDDGSNRDEIENMMQALAGEAEAGKFRALRGEYLRLAMSWQMKKIANRVPGVSAAFSAEMRSSKIRVGDPPGAASLVDGRGTGGAASKKSAGSGMIVANGCTKLVVDEHGCYLQFAMAQLDSEARKKMRRQRATGFSMEYSMTRFRIDDVVDVYYAGDDPFLTAKKTSTTTSESKSVGSEDKPLREFCVVAFPEIAKKYLTCPEEEEEEKNDDDEKRSDAVSSTPLPKRGCGTLAGYFRIDPARLASSNSASTVDAASKKKKPATIAAKPKHKKFDRDMFYVRAQDVYCSQS